MTVNRTVPRPKPERVTGIAHLFAAAGYSVSGAVRLWQETAFRHIIIGFPICVALLGIAGASFVEFSILAIMFLMLIAVEALNTAIECIVDHLAPNWEEFARDAKDLGSLATMCLLIAIGVYLSVFVLRFFALI
ncbi:MAG: diacylglycerol kinase [Sulfitobacter sp.]|uniref:diacylglycerol kinase n=1 Tax=Sulfitobacter sp. TaxID=1903071 RepID=UPI000C1163CD|nr:diacylglycerol kinase [Roseobacter sp.]MBV48943.1 diacylglycerol kinase [Roseobacter sp.]PHR10200.1 MAG: diacylglycerol kinase [Sulfitobacter sp.]THF93488.1 MAG: diacylglycerol kinase [Sulfitobacter sp. SK025]